MFPGVVIPITASRDKSIKLINDSNTNDKLIGVVSQKDSKVQSPSLNDIHPSGTVAKILRVLKMPDGNVTVIIQGKKRFSSLLFSRIYSFYSRCNLRLVLSCTNYL